MDKKTISISALSLLFIIAGCQNNETKQPGISFHDTKQVIKKIQFSPPSDSSITMQQMKSWSSCNSLLDSLALMYADSFKTATAQNRLRFEEDYIAAQDRICVLSGLTGGYKEYKWIMENMTLPKNQTVVNQANAAVF